MPAIKAANVEPIPGYRLVELLGRGGFGEVWKCATPDGQFKAVKFVADNTDALDVCEISGADLEFRAFNLIKSVRHPFILSVERAEHADGELLLVTELADRSLHDLLEACRRRGVAGLPREELLHYMTEAAEALDVLNLEYGLQHLDVKPGNLFLVGGHVKVADFGLVKSLGDVDPDRPLNLEALSPRYASPESFAGRITLFSDQYSLAITYHELLTGTLPFDGKNFRQLILQHVGGTPNLTRLPLCDRPIVARALAKEPRHRFSSCVAFVEALNAATRSTDAVSLPTMKVGTDPEIALEALKSTTTMPRAGTPASGFGTDGTLPGYQYVECLTRGPLGELWQVLRPDGRPQLVRIIAGVEPTEAALERLRTLKHPALIDHELIVGPGRLAVLRSQPATNLADRLREAQGGLPRGDVLEDLRDVAEALDLLHQREGMQHLTLSPRLLVPTDRGVTLADYGLAELVWLPGGQRPAALNPRYAAPELFDQHISPASDQYSLALIFQELLTGVHPVRNANLRQIARNRRRGDFDRTLVPASDRAALQKALHPDPAQRFACCAELIDALTNRPAAVTQMHIALPTGIRPAVRPGIATAPPDQVRRILAGLTDQALGGSELRESGGQRYFLDRGEAIVHHFSALLMPATVPLKLVGLRQQWATHTERRDGDQYTFQVALPGSLWQRLTRRTPGLSVTLRLRAPRGGMALTTVTAAIRPVRCSAEEGAALLEQHGPTLLESLRTCFHACPERRCEERLPFDQEVQVTPAGGRVLVAQARDVSPSGMGLYLPCRPQSAELLVRLEDPTEPGRSIRAVGRVMRIEPAGNGRFAVGLLFGERPA